MARTRDQDSLTAELPYWVIRDGLVLLADGTYEVGVEASLPATTLWSSDAVHVFNAQIRSLLRHAVPDGERLRVMVEVGPDNGSLITQHGDLTSGAHPSIRLLTDNRLRAFREAQQAGRLIDYRVILSCTLHPPSTIRRRRWMTIDTRTYAGHQHAANLLREGLLVALGRAGIQAKPLDDSPLFATIWRYFNPDRRARGTPPPLPHMDFEAPPELLARFPHLSRPTVRSQALGSDIARRWNHLWVDDHYVMIVSMDQLPTAETQVGMLHPLLTLPCWFWLVLDFVHDPHGQAVRALETRARRLHAASTEEAPVTDYVDPRVRVGFEEADSGLQHAYSTGNHLFRIGTSVVVLARELDTVRTCAHKTVDAFGQIHGIKAIVETAGLWQQFVALSPYSGRTNERLYRVFEENAADFFPTSGPWRGQGRPTCLFWSQWDSLVSLDPFDPRASSWNAIVVGASGSGKTFFVQSLIAQLLKHNVEALIVDRGGGYAHLARALDGQVIPIDGSGTTSLNPFDLPVGMTAPLSEKRTFLQALLRAMLGSDTSPDPDEGAVLNAAIDQTYARATATRRNALGTVTHTFDGVRLSDFITTLITMEELGDRAMSAHELDLARQLSGRLQPWAGDSALGRLLDRPSNVQLNAPIVYFETSGLDHHPALREVVLLLLSDVIWRRVQEHPEHRKLVIFDEAWALLRNPHGAAFIGELYRRFRRYGAAVYTIAQSLDDFLTHGAGGILENTTYHFLLQLPKQLDQAVHLFGLGDRAREVLARLSVRKGVFGEVLAWVRYDDNPTGEVLVVRPTPMEYWLFTSYDRDVRVRDAALAEAAGQVMPAIARLASTWPEGTARLKGEESTHA